MTYRRIGYVSYPILVSCLCIIADGFSETIFLEGENFWRGKYLVRERETKLKSYLKYNLILNQCVGYPSMKNN